MSMPINLLLLRHGESEGNIANHRSKQGDHSDFSQAFRSRPSMWWRLTDRGRAQAEQAGRTIAQLLAEHEVVIDRRYVSPYARAMETAGYLGLHGPDWLMSSELRERSWGELDGLPRDERNARYAQQLLLQPEAPFYWRPPDGESLAEVQMRLNDVLGSLDRESKDGALLVCHGEVMAVNHRLLTRMGDQAFAQWMQSDLPEDKMHNCSLYWYTRKDPETGVLSPYLDWYRHICAADPSIADSGWQKIVRPKYTNQELLDTAANYQALITG